MLKYIHSSSIKLSSLMVVISLNRAQDYLRIFMSASNGNYKCGFNRNAKDAEMQFEFKRSFIFQRIENIIFFFALEKCCISLHHIDTLNKQNSLRFNCQNKNKLLASRWHRVSLITVRTKHRLITIQITDWTLDVVFSRFKSFSFTITLRQKPKDDI